jgi:ElaB/YqjD/DUF883 family membrane-anchored ribosome-binding protein
MAIRVKNKVVHKSDQDTREADAILQKMGQIRDDLDDGVQEIVERAREMQDWRTYMKSHPWVFVSAAVAVGYLLIPRRIGRAAEISQVLPTKSKLSGVLGFVGIMVLREVVSFVGRQASESLMSQYDKSSTNQKPLDTKP